MGTDPQLETYLTALDKALGPIPVSDRADILIEIKSHILDSLEKNPQATVNSLLAALGEPEQVANRYLIERGLKPNRQSRAPIIKWLTIGFLGTFGIICGVFILLVWKFSPLIAVDEKQDRVRILGGLIDINGAEGQFKFSFDDGFSKHQFNAEEFVGAKKLAKETKEIQVPFSNGKLKISPSTDGQVHWKCKMIGANGQGVTTESHGIFKLDLQKSGGAKCDIELPAIKSVIQGANGKVALLKPQSAIEVVIFNGKVEIAEDKTKNYKFDLQVTNGSRGNFVSSPASDAIPIKVAISNGKIDREEAEE